MEGVQNQKIKSIPKQFLPIKMQQWEGQLARCLWIQYMVYVVGIWVRMQYRAGKLCNRCAGITYPFSSSQ
jgi:hypothetical protein